MMPDAISADYDVNIQPDCDYPEEVLDDGADEAEDD